jgi:hypothetical protein
MTKQEIFDKVWDHFVVKGNPRSYTETEPGGVCRFRLDKTAECPVRCAVGLFIPDDVYDVAMDSYSSVYDLRDEFDLPADLDELFTVHSSLFHALQAAHDSTASETDLPAAFREVARRHSLTVPKAGSPP